MSTIALAAMALASAGSGPGGPDDGPATRAASSAMDASGSEWLHAARDGSPLALDTPYGVFTFDLRENPELFAPGLTVADGKGQTVDMSGVHPLAGTVREFPGSVVRITLIAGAVSGLVLLPSGEAFTVSAAAAAPVTVSAHSDPPPTLGRQVDPEPLLQPIAIDHVSCLHPTPLPLADATGLVGGWPTQRTLSVAFATDASFEAYWGGGWAGVATSFANAVDGFYAAQINLRIQVADLHSHTDATFPGATGSLFLSQLKNHYTASHAGLSRENVHLLTGQVPSNVLGQANCIGGAGNINLAYTMSQAAQFEPINFLGVLIYLDGYVKVVAHEIGHILAAHHHYANCAESATAFSASRPVDTCTLMFNFVDFQLLKFSTVNKEVTRGWADFHNI